MNPVANGTRRKGSESWRTDKRKTAERGYGGRWQKARGAFIAKHPYCVMCLRDAGITFTEIADIVIACMEKRVALPAADVVDHKVPHKGDMALFWDKSNWQSLCMPHHSGEKQMLERSGRVVVRIGVDGWPVSD